MCLYTLNKTPKVAEQDITCYKLLLRDRKSGRYYTPYRRVEVTIPGLVESKSKAIPSLCYDSVMLWAVDCEGVHAYVEREKAAAVVVSELTSIFYEPLVSECRIPAGTEYWLGEDGDIAARKMIIEKKY